MVVVVAYWEWEQYKGSNTRPEEKKKEARKVSHCTLCHYRIRAHTLCLSHSHNPMILPPLSTKGRKKTGKKKQARERGR